jgi:DNA mismatch endonuclease (patch repair protein)
MRLARLAGGHNGVYWMAKIKRNVERDRQQTRKLEEDGWCVLRYWERDILRHPREIADAIVMAMNKRHVARLM